MLLLIVILLMTFTVLAGYACWQYRIRRCQRQEREVAIDWLQDLLGLLMLLQQRRGMMGAYLNGQHQLQGKLGLISEQAKMKQRSLNTSRLPVVKGDSWHELDSAVSDLLVQQFDSAVISFEAHSHLFSRILNYIWCVAECYQLMTDRNTEKRCQAEQALRRLPGVAELLGQMRALSIMMASRGYCSAAFRLRLIYLAEQVEKMAAQTSLSAQPAAGFLQLVEKEVIEQRQISIGPDKLFASATEAIDAYLSHSQALIQRL